MVFLFFNFLHQYFFHQYFFIRIFFIRRFFIRVIFIRIFLIRMLSIRIRRNFYIVNKLLRNLFLSITTYLYSSKLEDNNFYLFYKKNQSKRLQTNKLRTFPWYFIIMKICVDFSILRFYSSF